MEQPEIDERKGISGKEIVGWWKATGEIEGLECPLLVVIAHGKREMYPPVRFWAEV